MARQMLRQNSFASGELDEKVQGRDDLDRYGNGLRTMVNWLPVVQGGMKRFPGTEYIAELLGPTRLESFEFAVGEEFLFAFRDGVLDIYKDDALHQTISPTVWTEEEQAELDYTQALDTVIITHGDHPPYRIFRGPGDVFVMEDLSDIANPSSIFLENIPQVDGADAWTDALGWPRTCTFFENRLLFGGSKSYQNTGALSKSGDFFDFDLGGALADDGIFFELLSDQLEAIQWVAGIRRLTIGTSSSVWAVVQDAFVTPDEFNLKRQNGIGSKRISPVTVDGEILHTTRNGDQLRGVTWNDIEQAMVTSGLSLLNSRAIVGCTQLAVKDAISEDDANLVFSVNSNGELGVLNTLTEQEFIAWCRRTFSGSAESVTAVGDNIYVVVSYPFGEGVFVEDVFEGDVFEEQGSSSVRFLVKFDEALYADYSKTKTVGVATDNFTGFDHLIGSTVQVRLDGALHPDVVVAADGSITTQIEGLACVAGVAIPTPTGETMPPAINAFGSSKVLLPKRIIRTLVEVLDTVSLKVAGEQLQFREASDDVNAPVPPFTGIKEVRVIGRERRPTVLITAEEAAPATVLSMDTEVGF